MNYTGKKIALINLPVLMSILTEQLINITDAVFLGHVGDVELGASALAGITRTKALTVAALTAVVVNIPGNYLLLFRLDLGIAGAAMASAAAELCSLAVLLFLVRGDRDKSRYGLHYAPDLKVLGAVLRISVWSMFQSFISVAPWFLFFVAVEHLGETELAAANIIRSVSALFFVIVSSFGTTTGSLAGNLTGAGEAEKIPALCGKVIRLGYAAGGPLIVLALVFRRQEIGLYTDNPALVEAAALPFAVMLMNYAFALPAYVWMNAVSGTGATRTAFLFQAVTIVFYLAYLWAVSCLQAPFLAFWGAEYLFVILLGLQSLVYLRKRRD